MNTVRICVVSPVLLALILGPLALPLASQAEESPYVEIAGRPVKALSQSQMDDYLEGRGMGLALAAELNGYPGPMHVLDLADELDLSAAQLGQVEQIFADMQSEAIELGRQIVERERQLDELFAERRIDSPELLSATDTLGRLNGQLRGVHLAAHLATVAVLLPAQEKLYMTARGYDTMGGHDPAKHHH